MCSVIYCCHVKFLLHCKPVLVTQHPDQRQMTDEKLSFFFMYIRLSPHMYRNIYTHTLKGPLYKIFTKAGSSSHDFVFLIRILIASFKMLLHQKLSKCNLLYWEYEKVISLKQLFHEFKFIFVCSFCINFYRCKII